MTAAAVGRRYDEKRSWIRRSLRTAVRVEGWGSAVAETARGGGVPAGRGAHPVGARRPVEVAAARAGRGPDRGVGLTYPRIVEEVTGSGISQGELGQAVGASLRSVQSWAAGGAAPRGASRERLLDVKYLVEDLQDVYTPEGVQIWLHARNRNLGGRRPMDLLIGGESAAVLEEAQRLSGAM